MARQKIPRLTPYMLRNLPDQTCEIINQIIDEINSQ